MLRKVILFISVITAALASAKELSPSEIRDRLQLNADIYLMDSSGKKILLGPKQTNYWRSDSEKGVIDGDWTAQNEDGMIAFHQRWSVEDDGTIKVSMEEYGGISENQQKMELKNLLEKKEIVLENFAPIVWKAKGIKNKNYVVRFTPSLRELSKPISVDVLPIAGTGISITDNQGYLWAEDIEFNGKYSGLKSHRGTLAISYVSFPGAREIGIAEGQKITINVDKKIQIILKSATSFLPAGLTAKVYALYLPEKKSKGFHSVHSFDSNKEDRFLASLKR